MLAQPTFEGHPDHPFGMDIYTLRLAASRTGRGVEPADAMQAAALRAPHTEIAAHARLVGLACEPRAEVAIGVLCRIDEVAGVAARLAPHAAWAHEIVILADGDERDAVPIPVVGFGTVDARAFARPLAGDFAAQRNALQDACRSAWVLQLDADESLSVKDGVLIPALAFRCGREGVMSVGLARQNRVDGVCSDVFPDVQYRLNRQELRYSGRVHERPVRDWQKSMIALHGTIIHDLSRSHVLARSARYEALDPGRGRLEETERLLAPYRS